MLPAWLGESGAWEHVRSHHTLPGAPLLLFFWPQTGLSSSYSPSIWSVQRSLWESTPSEPLLGVGKSDAPTALQENKNWLWLLKTWWMLKSQWQLLVRQSFACSAAGWKQQIFNRDRELWSKKGSAAHGEVIASPHPPRTRSPSHPSAPPADTSVPWTLPASGPTASTVSSLLWVFHPKTGLGL